MVGIFVLGKHLRCFPAKPETPFPPTCSWGIRWTKGSQMKVLVDSINLDYLVAQKSDSFIK